MNVSKKITQILVEEHVVTIDNFELYEYSINAVLEMGGNILVSLLLGILLERLAETALFLVVIQLPIMPREVKESDPQGNS